LDPHIPAAVPRLRLGRHCAVEALEKIFANTDLQIIGLHSVFEHHAAMDPVTLEAFLHEYRIKTPVGVDLADPSSDVPLTMRRYGFRGTPSSVLIGRDGSIVHVTFGVEDDIALGARIATALASSQLTHATDAAKNGGAGCADGRCEVEH